MSNKVSILQDVSSQETLHWLNIVGPGDRSVDLRSRCKLEAKTGNLQYSLCTETTNPISSSKV